MREIKFRAWDGTRFHYFSLSTLIDGFADDCAITPAGESTSIASWMQITEFTGLQGKNGVDIYEGDIFRAPHDFGPGGFAERTAVVFFDAVLGYQWQYWNLDKLEVIGNRYENPELLEE